MDPNQNNQGDDNTGENRQAIFTPQPQVPDTSAAIPESAQASDGSSTHPYFSSHPTQTFNTDAGDIIIRTDEPKAKHNKRPFIIGGIILAAFVVICAVVLAFIPKDGDRSTSNVNGAQAEFNRFATYILYGTASNTLVGEYDPEAYYDIDLQVADAEFHEEYWTRASGLLERAIDVARNDESITRYLVKSLQDYQQSFNFVRAYSQKKNFDEERLMSVFLNSGMNSATSLIDDFYNEFNNLDSNVARSYVESRKQQYNDTLRMFSIYSDLGCVHDGKITESNCSRTASDATLTDFESLTVAVSKASSAADRIVQNSVTYLKSRCWELSEWFQNPVDERDGGEQ